MNGGRWRSRRCSSGRTSSIVTVDSSHFERTTSVEHCALRAMSATARSPVDDPPARRRSARARCRRARPPRARAAPSSTRSPGAASACAAGRRCRRARSRPSPLEHGVDRVARRSGHVRDDHALAAEQRVQRATTCRRSAGRGSRRESPPRPRLGPRRVRPLEVRDHLVEQVAGAVAVQRRERDRVAEAELVELERERVAPGSSILFAIRSTGLCESRRISATSSSPGVMPICASTTKRTRSASATASRACIGDRPRHRVGARDVDAAGVDEQEALAVPLADELLAVARDTGRLVHDRGARRRQPVDERRLADVREADDRDRPGTGPAAGWRVRFDVRSWRDRVSLRGRPCAWTSASQSKRC